MVSPRRVTDACTSVTCRVSTDQSLKVAEDGGREVLVEVGRHCGYRSGGGSTPRQRRGAGSRRPHACTGGRGIFGVPSSAATLTPSQSRITLDRHALVSCLHPLAKLMTFREPNGEPAEADARRRPATSGDEESR